MKKELKTLINLAVGQGWSVSINKSGHYKWVAPNGKIVFSSSTPSDNRALKNLERDLKANGFIVIKRR